MTSVTVKDPIPYPLTPQVKPNNVFSFFSEMFLLQYWLLFISALSLFGSIQGFFSKTVLQKNQFSKQPQQGREQFFVILNQSHIN